MVYALRLAILCGAALAIWLIACAPNPAVAAPKGKAAAPIAGGEGGPADALTGADVGNDAPPARPIPPKTGLPAPVTLTAYLSEGSAPVVSDIVWRVYEGKPGADGSYKLLQTIREARPTIELKPGEYLINAAYGRASLTKKVGVWPEKPQNEDFVINAGGLRVTATLAKSPITSENLLKLEVLTESQEQFSNRQKVADVRPGVVYRLNSGLYHIVSTYGDANSVITSDVVIEPGRITEAVVDHDAGKITLRLVQRAGGEAVADTRWTLYNSNGEIVRETAGAFSTHILAAGDYRVAAEHGGRQYATAFTVAAGDTKIVEVVMQ